MKTALGTIGSGNVFADLGLPDPETELAKANVVMGIDEAIEKGGMTRARAARMMGMPLRKLTRLLSGYTEPHTIDGLKKLLSRLSV